MLNAVLNRYAPGAGLERALSNRYLYLILLPTERCNFRCTYCYEDFRLSRMSKDVVGGVKRLLTQRMPDLDRLDVSWFGGEPLAAADIVTEVMEHVQELQRLHPQVLVAGEMTTNADMLSYERARALMTLGVRKYQITLDGVKADHDAVRRRADGRGTFDSIWENLVDLKRQPACLSVTVRIHVTEANLASLPVLLEACAKEFAYDRRFSFFIRPLSRLGGPNDAALPILSAEESQGIVSGLRRTARMLGLFVPPTAWDVCYAARANAWVVRSNGDLNKCTVALADPRNRVGRLHADGTLSIDASLVAPWMRGLATGSVDDLGCPWRGMARQPPVSNTKTAA